MIQHKNIRKSSIKQLKHFVVNRIQQEASLKRKAPHFYINPKVHKKYIPARPVVSSIDCHTSKIFKFVNHYLQPHTKILLFCVKETIDFIKKKPGKVKKTSKESILVTLHLKALQTNIPIHEGMESVKETFNNQAKEPIARRVTIKFLYLTLILNNFVFNGINYLQTKDCPIGTICAPAYANICMEKFEKLNIYPYLNFSTFQCQLIQIIYFSLEWNRI